MSTRHLAPVAQYREPRNAAAAAVLGSAYIVLQEDGTYTVSDTGPADAFFADDGAGGIVIDPAATAHAAGIRFNAAGGNITLYGTLA